jgi:hypothetical protein
MVVAGLIAMAVASTAAAAESWSLSKLVPFQKSSASKRTKASVSDEDRKSWMPSMPSWGTSKKKPSASREPSTLNKLNKGTKEFFGKTKDVLMPWSKSSKKPAARPVSTKKTPAKTPWYKSWFTQKEPEKKPMTVSDFIGQDRPEF